MVTVLALATCGTVHELMRASMDAYSCAGARGGYIYWAKQVSTEIVDVVANSPVPGEVKIYVLMAGIRIAVSWASEMENSILHVAALLSGRSRR